MSTPSRSWSTVRSWRAVRRSNPLVRIRSLNNRGMAANMRHYPDGHESLDQARALAAADGLWSEESRALINQAWAANENMDVRIAADCAQRAMATAARHEIPVLRKEPHGSSTRRAWSSRAPGTRPWTSSASVPTSRPSHRWWRCPSLDRSTPGAVDQARMRLSPRRGAWPTSRESSSDWPRLRSGLPSRPGSRDTMTCRSMSCRASWPMALRRATAGHRGASVSGCGSWAT